MKTRRLTKGSSQKDVARIIGEEQARFEREKDKPRRYVRPGRPALAVAERAEVYSLRIPAARIGELKAVAAKKNKKPAALARDWVLERLDGEVKKKPKAIAGSRRRVAKG
jgi:hypothetical protein